MKKLLFTGLGLLALAGLADEAEAAKHVSGRYALQMTYLCQSVWTKDAVTSHLSLLGGDMRHSIGLVTFVPTTTTGRHGSFSGKVTEVSGWPDTMTTSGIWSYPTDSRFGQSTRTFSGTYVMTDTQLTLNFGSDVQTYQAYYTDLTSNKLVRNVGFIRMVDGTTSGVPPTEPDCSQHGTLIRG